MHWYRDNDQFYFINKVNEALNRCDNEISKLHRSDIRELYRHLIIKKPNQNWIPLLKSFCLLLHAFVMAIIPEKKFIRAAQCGIGESCLLECKTSKFNEEKRVYEDAYRTLSDFVANGVLAEHYDIKCGFDSMNFNDKNQLFKSILRKYRF